MLVFSSLLQQASKQWYRKSIPHLKSSNKTKEVNGLNILQDKMAEINFNVLKQFCSHQSRQKPQLQEFGFGCWTFTEVRVQSWDSLALAQKGGKYTINHLCAFSWASWVGLHRSASLQRLNPVSAVACSETSKPIKLGQCGGLKGVGGRWRKVFHGREKVNCGLAGSRRWA